MPYEVAQNRRNAFVKAGMAWRRELPPGEISHFARLLLNGTWLRDKVVALAKLNTRAWQGSVVSVFPDSISVFPGLPSFDFRISIESWSRIWQISCDDLFQWVLAFQHKHWWMPIVFLFFVDQKETSSCNIFLRALQHLSLNNTLPSARSSFHFFFRIFNIFTSLQGAGKPYSA